LFRQRASVLGDEIGGLDSRTSTGGHEGRSAVVETISREELKEKMDRGEDLVVVDTMAEMYYRHSHLPGAINLPVEEVGERAPELVPDKDADIIVYCIDPP
jgi:hypothetical protein